MGSFIARKATVLHYLKAANEEDDKCLSTKICIRLADTFST